MGLLGRPKTSPSTGSWVGNSGTSFGGGGQNWVGNSGMSIGGGGASGAGSSSALSAASGSSRAPSMPDVMSALSGAAGGGGGVPGTPSGGGGGGGRSGGGGAGGVASASPNLNTKTDPQIQAAINALSKQVGTLQAGANAPSANLKFLVDEYKKRLGEDNTPEAEAAMLAKLRSAAGGMMEQSAGRIADTGGAGVGGDARTRSRISDAAAREAAKGMTNLELARQGRADALTLGGLGIMGAQDQLNLSRTGQVNDLLGTQVNASVIPSNIALAQAGLGLQAYNAETGRYGAETQRQALANDSRQADIANYLRVLSTFYGGY